MESLQFANQVPIQLRRAHATEHEFVAKTANTLDDWAAVSVSYQCTREIGENFVLHDYRSNSVTAFRVLKKFERSIHEPSDKGPALES